MSELSWPRSIGQVVVAQQSSSCPNYKYTIVGTRGPRQPLADCLSSSSLSSPVWPASPPGVINAKPVMSVSQAVTARGSGSHSAAADHQKIWNKTFRFRRDLSFKTHICGQYSCTLHTQFGCALSLESVVVPNQTNVPFGGFPYFTKNEHKNKP